MSTPTPNAGFQDFFATTLAVGCTNTDTVIYLNSVPTPSEGWLVIEPDDTTNKEIIHYTSTGANFVQLTNLADRGVSGTSARAHSSGVVVRMNVTGQMFSNLQSGNILSAGAITPEKLQASTGTSWAWQTWTPTFTGWVRGTGGAAAGGAYYRQVGKTIHFKIYEKLGTGGGFGVSGAITFTLPVTATSQGLALDASPLGPAVIEDAGTSFYFAMTVYSTTTTARLYAGNGTAPRMSDTSSSFPMIWTSGDAWYCQGTYEAA